MGSHPHCPKLFNLLLETVDAVEALPEELLVWASHPQCPVAMAKSQVQVQALFRSGPRNLEMQTQMRFIRLCSPGHPDAPLCQGCHGNHIMVKGQQLSLVQVWFSAILKEVQSHWLNKTSLQPMAQIYKIARYEKLPNQI